VAALAYKPRMRERLISGLGMVMILALAFAFCPRERRAHVRRRTLLGGLGLLLLSAVLLLATPIVNGFGAVSAAVERLLGFTYQGTRFVFGALAEESSSFGFVFAFRVLPTILFFSALMSTLYHLGIWPWGIERGGRLLSKALGVSGAESFSTVADVFVGQTACAWP
jgi:concentrative nucleoside transporter, CNT family